MDLNESSNSVSMSDSSSDSSSDTSSDSSCDSPSPVRVRATVGEETKGDDTLVQSLYDPKGKSIVLSGTHERSSTMRSLSMGGADPTRRLGGGDFKAHMLMINAREEIIEKIMSFTQNGSRGICVLSATGAVFNLRIQSLGSNRVLTFKDCYEIISLTNTVEITESGGVRNETGVWRITIGGVDGCVFGGNLVGRLTAASQVQVVIGSFWPLTPNPSLRKKDTSTSVLVTPTVPNAVGSSSGGQVHQPEMRGSSHFSSSEWYRKYSDLYSTMATITAVKARQIFDSRGNPTVEVDVHTSSGVKVTAAVPSGASTGIYEALELRDGGSDYLGKGVSKAVGNVNSIIGPALIGKDPTQQTAIDNFMVHELDGTQNEWGWCKQKLGANAILAVSLAVCKAGAVVSGIPLYKHIANLAGNPKIVLPVPAFNVINGGSHAGNKLAMQEFMILPVGASSFKEAMKMGVEVYHNLKSVIKKKYGQDATNVGDEGGFAPNIQENKEGLELLKTAIEKAGYTGKVVIGMDVAASEFYSSDKTYDLNFKEENNNGSQKISGDALKDLYKSFVAEYPIVSIEDPFDQDDWEHYAKMTAECGDNVQIVGDDLLVTNPKRVAKAIAEKSCNALLLKVNQIGSVTESIEAVKMSKRAGWGVMASHRSGETEDTFIADLSVGLSTGQIKTGAPCRSERLAKYNQLLRIEEELGSEAVYAGANFRKPVEPY
ncbi:unnamed protein product [Brassica rapa subsp. trilocularis]|uniref:phosphopyruvate hydratase n=7 Tax=Magnoliopsida TaxID=3398 RepID=A0A816VND4_BRANA|nr:unnamed protein product [Brassica napus]